MNSRTLIRKDGDHALRIVAHVAGQRERLLPAASIVRDLGLPLSFTQKILRRLVRAGIFHGRGGNGGGFGLARGVDEISLLDVITAVQPRPLISRCAAGGAACPRLSACPISRHLRSFQAKLDAFLASARLSLVLGAVDRGRRGGRRSASDSADRSTTCRM